MWSLLVFVPPTRRPYDSLDGGRESGDAHGWDLWHVAALEV